MKYVLFLSVGFFLLGTIQGQPPPGPPKHEPGVDENCVYRNMYSETERLKFYPFNISDTIKLVSFRAHPHNYPIDKTHVTTDSLIEQIVLSKAEVIQLTDILYNNVSRKRGTVGSVNNCYEPRNAILFTDKKGKLKEYVMICFHCDRYVMSSDDLQSWDKCYQKSELIRQFFISAGIKFGTDPTITEYPGE